MNKVREIRKAKGLTQVQLGVLTRIPSPSICKIEMGEICRRKTAEKIANALGTTVKNLWPDDHETLR